MAQNQPPLFLNEAALGQLRAGVWHRGEDATTVCFDLPKGASTLRL
jgi:hypothetical protein